LPGAPERFERERQGIDTLHCDVTMPGLPGFEVAQRLRQLRAPGSRAGRLRRPEAVEWDVLGAHDMNVNTLIVVADSARARLFRIVKTDAPRAPFVLQETESLVHPEARIKQGDRHTGSVSVAHSGQGGHTLDDHRGAHDAEERRRFAKAVCHSVARSVMEHDHPAVIALSTHALHALLAGELERELPKDLRVRSEIGEFSEMSPSALLEELERRGLL